MVAPGTTAPNGSATTPLSDEFPVVCALASLAQRTKQKSPTTNALTNLCRNTLPVFSCFDIISSPICLALSSAGSPQQVASSAEKSDGNRHQLNARVLRRDIAFQS